MARIKMTTICLALFVFVSTGTAWVWQVPEVSRSIQYVIDSLASDGDTIAVWGEGSPPFVYYECIDYRGKALYIANACYLPNPPAPPNPDDVVIDAQMQDIAVRINGIAKLWACVLQGISARNGYNTYDYGGSIEALPLRQVLNSARVRFYFTPVQE